MMISNEMLSAYRDGELSPEEAARVREAIATDELLAARLRQYEQVDRLLAGFAGSIDAEPMPAAVLRALGQGGETDATARTPQPVPSPGTSAQMRRMRVPLALAASLLAGVAALALVLVVAGRPDPIERIAAGPVAPGSDLYRALESVPSATQLESVAIPGLRVTPQLSFVSTGDRLCREFHAAHDMRAVRGIACRADGRWDVLLTTPAQPLDTGGGYAVASGDASAAFDDFAEELMGDAPLSAAEELDLLRANWQRAAPVPEARGARD